MAKKLKDTYVGKVFIVDSSNGSVLLEGTGTFLCKNSVLHTHYETGSFDAIEDVNWLPILETEDGYFSPAHFRRDTIVAFPFQASSRNSFSMESYFNWPTDSGLGYLFDNFDSLYVDVKSKPQSTITFNKDRSATLTVEADSKTLCEASCSSVNIEAKLIYSARGYSIAPAIRFSIETQLRPLSDWLNIVHAYRLYWVLHSDRINSESLTIFFGEKLRLHTSLLTFEGYTDNTYAVEDALKPNSELNVDLLARCIDFLLNSKDRKIQQSVYSLLAIRFSEGIKNIVDDPLRIVFSLDGFTSAFLKKDKKNKSLKKQQIESIDKVLEFVEKNKDQLDADVYEFYSKDASQIYSLLSQRPFKESVQSSFEKLGIEYSKYESTVSSLNEVRQTFVHGKDYDIQQIAKILFTHSTHDIKRSDEGAVTQISFGQKMGLVDEGYKMLKELYLAYLSK